MFKCKAGDEFIPRRATKHSAGYDFFATEDIVIKAGEWTTVDTQVYLEEGSLLPNWVMKIYPRSSTGFKQGLRIRNTTGIIDADYHDTIKAVLTCDNDYVIKKGERYMQGIICDYYVMFDEITPEEERKGGIGSTGA